MNQVNVRDTPGARWDLLFRVLLNTNAKIYLQLANSNPLHQQLHLNQLSNHCLGFQGQESFRALGWFLCGKKCPCHHLGTLRGHCPGRAVGWGFCTQDCRTGSRG